MDMTPQSQSFLSGLFRYRERQGRSPREDFLTEALCHLLNLLDEEKRTPEALQRLFGIKNGRAYDQLRWQTQYVIPSGEGAASGKRPDLVGKPPDGGNAIVIIENKIAAPFTEHFLEDGESQAHQLDLYRTYASTKYKPWEVVLLTHLTAVPQGWDNYSVTWIDIHVRLRKDFKLPSNPTPADRFVRELRLFLEEYNMAEIKIERDEIKAYAAWKRLREKIGELGINWPLVEGDPLRPVHNKLKQSGFGATPGGGYGHFHWERYHHFSGTLFTPVIGDKILGANDSNIYVYFGVLIDTVYECITTSEEGSPEFTAGIAVWHDREKAEEQADFLKSIRAKLGWKLQTCVNTTWGPATVVSIAQPFSSVDNSDTDWRAQANKFYITALQGLARQLSDSDLQAIADMQSE